MSAFNEPKTRKEREAKFSHFSDEQLKNLSEKEKTELYYLIRDRNFGVYTKEEQEKIRKAKICVAGQGCVGELAAVELARIGFGTIRIIDQDELELSNLNRNAYGRYSQIGKFKTENMKSMLDDATARTVNIEVINEMINTKNAENAFKGMDIIIQGIDNMYARVIVHRAAKKLGIPVITMSGGPPYRAFVSTVLPNGIDYETLLNLPTKGMNLDVSNQELDKLHHELRKNRAEYAMKHGANPEWAKMYLDGDRMTWSITPERAYITSTIQAHEAVNLILGRPLMAKAPKIVWIDLMDPKNISVVKSPPKGKYWDYRIW
jgi:molybdopterin/thiamine biosynthesis adenylyltransferase